MSYLCGENRLPPDSQLQAAGFRLEFSPEPIKIRAVADQSALSSSTSAGSRSAPSKATTQVRSLCGRLKLLQFVNTPYLSKPTLG